MSEMSQRPDTNGDFLQLPDGDSGVVSSVDAENILLQLAGTYAQDFLAASGTRRDDFDSAIRQIAPDKSFPTLEARYRALVEKLPAIVFMAFMDRGIGEAYVSPQIEATLGFSQQEWLEDPVRWYQQIHPQDKDRWSVEAAKMFLSGLPLRSVYRVLARDGRTVWFQCEANMVRHDDGRPWFIHGVGFDITELKEAEAALQEERNVLSAILDTVGALVVVVDREGRIVRFNRACEITTGYSFEEVRSHYIWDLFPVADELEQVKAIFSELGDSDKPIEYETYWATRNGTPRRISWSNTFLPHRDGSAEFIIVTGIDVTERQRLQKTILEISSREQRRIGQDLHDGLGQHLTGIAFMSKVLQQKLAESALPESADADKILKLVNAAVSKSRELARGLIPVMSDSHGLMSGLKQLASEVEDLFKISCRFDCDDQVLIGDVNVATHLYHIAQEAVNNAIRHGKATHVIIRLSSFKNACTLTITDDGVGIPDTPSPDGGMGLHIMRYRASMIAGTLQVGRAPLGGTSVECAFSLKHQDRGEGGREP
ncbi:MAG: PAS domain S-box protein [Candidatus Acidiferrales bacterium]